MAQRIEFTTPVALVFKGLEIDRIDSIDVESGQVTGFFSLLREDGKRWRSLPFTINAPAIVKNFEAALLNRLLNQTAKVDGVDAPLAGTIKDVADGTPIPLR